MKKKPQVKKGAPVWNNKQINIILLNDIEYSWRD